MGVPQKKIKFFIGREFKSKDDILRELRPKVVSVGPKVFTWVDWIWKNFEVHCLPMMLVGEMPAPMSRSELKRLFDNKSIEINGKFPTSKDECKDEDFPIQSWVWFPNGKRKTFWV